MRLILAHNGMEVHGELSLTQSLVSELITTSLWAKNSKGFLAYHCFNYRGGEEKGLHTAVWLHGRKLHRLGRNPTGCLQGTCSVLKKTLLFSQTNVKFHCFIFTCLTHKKLQIKLNCALKKEFSSLFLNY